MKSKARSQKTLVEEQMEDLERLAMNATERGDRQAFLRQLREYPYEHLVHVHLQLLLCVGKDIARRIMEFVPRIL